MTAHSRSLTSFSANFRSVVFVLRFVRLPPGRERHPTKNLDFGCFQSDAISKNVHRLQRCSLMFFCAEQTVLSGVVTRNWGGESPSATPG